MYGRCHTSYQSLLSVINALIEQHETIVRCSSPLTLILPNAETFSAILHVVPTCKQKIIFGATS